MVSRSLVLGHHGCDESTALKIITGQQDQPPSKNEYDWLGSGLYFWEDSSARFEMGSRRVQQVSWKSKKPAVLGAIIELGNCLNLIDAGHMELVVAAHKAYLDIFRSSESTPMQNKRRDLRARYLDKAVFETLHKLREDEGEAPFDTVRAFFVEGQPLYENAGLRALDHVQICVRNPKNIIGYFLPRG